jgi:caffeoyl-CoA O-methyltransferase
MLDEALTEYVRVHSAPMDPIAQALIDETSLLPNAGMQVAPEQGSFLKLLVQLTGAASVLEIGTFTGFSALCMARGLPEGGRLIACDVSDEWTSIGRRYWERAGVADRIDLRIGPALDTLAAMSDDIMFDLVFLDADKPGYPDYFAAVADRVKPGGVLIADNVLRHGRVIDGDSKSESVQAIREFNDAVAADERFEVVLLAAYDGLTFARRLSV